MGWRMVEQEGANLGGERNKVGESVGGGGSDSYSVHQIPSSFAVFPPTFFSYARGIAGADPRRPTGN